MTPCSLRTQFWTRNAFIFTQTHSNTHTHLHLHIHKHIDIHRLTRVWGQVSLKKSDIPTQILIVFRGFYFLFVHLLTAVTGVFWSQFCSLEMDLSGSLKLDLWTSATLSKHTTQISRKIRKEIRSFIMNTWSSCVVEYIKWRLKKIAKNNEYLKLIERTYYLDTSNIILYIHTIYYYISYKIYVK